MKESVKIGDVVQTTNGRNSGRNFLVIDVKDKFVYLVDGRKRKINSAKKKNIKHVKKVSGNQKDIAEKILNGVVVGNERVYRTINAQKQKIQED